MFTAVIGLVIAAAPASAVEAVGVTGSPAEMPPSIGSADPAVATSVAAPVEWTDPTGDPDPGDPSALFDAAASAAPSATLPPTEAPTAACTGTQDKPQLEPEALGTLNVRSDDPGVPTAASLGYDGTGVKVGIVSTAMDPSMPDFRRPDGTSAVVDYRQYTSAGPEDGTDALEGFGDVSSIVAQGTVAHDLATLVNPASVTLPDGHCWIRIVGVAPGAAVTQANTTEAGRLSIPGVVRAINDAVAEGSDVISLSLGGAQIPDTSERSAFLAATTAAVDAGVTVVVSSGDAGANSTIGSPATNPRVISVGATITGRLMAQIGALGVTRFGDGSWPSATAASLSSSGFDQDGRTIDVVAPGDSGWSVCSAEPRFPTCSADGSGGAPADIAAFAGTSQSAPLVAGVAALVIQAYRDTHGGRRPTPDQVERILTGTASDLGLPADVQGSGLVDARSAVLAARTLDDGGPAGPPAGGDAARTLVADTAQVALTGTGTQQLDVTVTNTSATPVPLQDIAITRDEPIGRQTFPIRFDPAAPTFAEGRGGAPAIAVRQDFAVAPGAAQLNIQLAGTTPSSKPQYPARVLVLDPSGAPAAYANGVDGTQVMVPAPEAGTWTAVVQTVPSRPYTGELAVERTERRVIATGRADTVSLAAGVSTTVRAEVPMTSQPGDLAATLRVADQLALPVVQRVPVDLSSGTAEVSTLVRPQNGRASDPSQQATWELDVPSGRRSLDVVADLRTPAVAKVTAVLVGPDGMPRSNAINTPDSSAPSISLSTTDPEPGRWRVVLLLYGTEWTMPATRAALDVTIALDRRLTSASGLPVEEEVSAGTSRAVTMTFRNPGRRALSVAVDPRTDSRTEIDAPLIGSSSVAVPLTSDTIGRLPIAVVPLFSTRLTVAAQSTVPLIVGLRSSTGSPFALSDLGRAGGPATTTTDPSIVVDDAGRAPGLWSVALATPGPVRQPAPQGTAEISARVETATYDPTVTDSSGRPLVTPSGPSSDVPLAVVQPGDTMTVTVTLPTRGAPGDRISGFLALTAPATGRDDTPGVAVQQRGGDVLAVFPYSYTVIDPDPTTTEPTSIEPTSTEPTTVPTTTEPTDQSTTTPTSTDPSTTESSTPPSTTGLSTTPSSTTPSSTAAAWTPSSTSAIDVIVPPLQVDPYVPVFVPSTSVAAVPFGPSTPAAGQYVSASGALPNTGFDLFRSVVAALLTLTVGLGLVLLARRSRRPGSD